MPYDHIDEVRGLTQAQVNKLTNPQLKTALLTMISADNGNPSNAVLLMEIRNLKKDIEEVKHLKREVEQLTTKLDQAYNIMHQQQLFLESFDARDRQRKLIITGVLEDEDDLGSDDREKIRTLLDKSGYTGGVNLGDCELKRLGRISANRSRPILLVVDSLQMRNAMLEKAKNLKTAGLPFSNVYVKKDIHPAIRKEFNRLHRREREEKDKPENQGTVIRYDSRERVLLRDGVVIDRYAPTFF